MPTVLIVAARPAVEHLQKTLLWRQDVKRLGAANVEQAVHVAATRDPNLILVDRDIPDAAVLLARLRSEPAASAVPLVIVTRGAVAPGETDAGSPVVHLPVSAEDDERLARLMHVPTRKRVRVLVSLTFEVRLTEFPKPVLGSVLDLSVQGMQVETPVALRLGTQIDFAFWVDGKPVVGVARVVRTAGPRRYGVVFKELRDDGVERVRRHIETRPQ